MTPQKEGLKTCYVSLNFLKEVSNPRFVSLNFLKEGLKTFSCFFKFLYIINQHTTVI